MKFEAVPYELKQLPQWVCWNGSKAPIDAKTGAPASVIQPSTWASYGVAVQAASRWNGIGFVLTDDDPYTFIDLDAGGTAEDMSLQRQVFEYFDSYTEFSPGGKGLHIIVKAQPPYSRRAHHIEVYGSQRYMTMTGHVYHNKPIEERQLHIEQLLSKLGKPRPDVPLIQGTQSMSDEDLWERMFRASNGDAIRALADGKWENRYTSQSEADFALINHLVFYTQCPDQVVRMFRSSMLGRRVKALRDDYVYGMIRSASDQLLPVDAPYIDVTAIKRNLTDSSRTLIQNEVPPRVDGAFPQGLVGDLAQFIMNSYSRPVPTIALVGALGMMSGICGRAYNVSGTGLNLYTLLLAQTGTGKDAIAQGIGRIRTELALALPAAADFVGPRLASGQALGRHLAERSSSFVSIFGEFGEELGRYLAPNAISSDRALITAMLDLYTKSGHNITVPGTVFSDRTKNTTDLVSPAFSFVADSTPEAYYSAIDTAAISKGLLPRFLVVEYDGPRVYHRNVPEQNLHLHPDVLERLVNLCDLSLRLMASNSCIDIKYMPDALDFLNEFTKAADDRINETQNTVTRQLWSRAHLKVLKVASILSIGCNIHEPTISLAQAQWAQVLVEADVRRVIARFDTGDVGYEGDLARNFEKRVAALRACLHQYPTFDPETPANANIRPGMQEARIIPHSVLRRHVSAYPAFRRSSGYRTPNQLFDEAVKFLIEDEALAQVNQVYLLQQFGYRGKAYQILNL